MEAASVHLVTGVLSRVIPKLGVLLKEEYDLQKGMKKKIARLSRDLESMHKALQKVAEVPPEQLDGQVKLWAHDVRELSYDAEDILDTFLVRVDSPDARDKNRFKRAVKKIGKLFSKGMTRRELGGMIKTINEQAKEVEERRLRYKVDHVVAKPVVTTSADNDDPRLEAMYRQVTQLVGIEKPMGKLVSMLSLDGDDESRKKMKTVSVVGVGGLGKTTLAKAVYDKVKVDFMCRAFIPVGRNPDLNQVFRNILVELDRNKYRNSNTMMLERRWQLINELREYLENKRYFIVIDDVWEKESWETIRLAFIQNNNGSRLIITTRKWEVAKEAGQVYEIEPLPCDKSKFLFCTRIFSAEGKCPEQLDEACDKILKKCDGIPLAIITMASLLVDKSRERWLEVCNSIGFRDTNKILSLSYYDLPPHLKTCLLYLSAFPEDYTIEKSSLIWKWVCEGFVQKEGSTGFSEVGEGYFNELINRSMIQPVRSEATGLLYGCRVHDMVLDVLRSISHEQKFVIISKNNDEGMIAPDGKVRRLAHQKTILWELTHQRMDLGHLRSLITTFCLYEEGISLASFKLLRVLSIETCKLVTGVWIPLNHLENLVHLKYLGLRGMDIIELPDGIGALKLLQTLDLEDTAIKELPSSIGMLTQLICLRANGVIVPNGVLEKLTSLEELRIFGEIQTFVLGLGKFIELRVLNVGIIDLDDTIHISAFAECLRRLTKIQHLHVQGIFHGARIWGPGMLSRRLQHLILSDGFYVLPTCFSISDLPNLTHLDLFLRTINCQDLELLGGLPELRHLKLDTDTSQNVAKMTVASTATDHCSFKKLRYCMLKHSIVQFVLNEDSSVSFTLWSGKGNVAFGSHKRDDRRVAPAVMPKLEELLFCVQVKNVIAVDCSCDNLGLEYLPSLQKVRIFFSTPDTNRDDRKKVKDALNKAMRVHPNNPTMEFSYGGF